VDQICRYHTKSPEVMVPQMLFTATEAIGFAYGVTWNMVRRNLFNWKHEETGNLEAKVKSFCAVPHLLRFLKDFILFAEKEEELQKVILRQHQTGAVDKVVSRALDPKRTRGLVWHTQGSGKTYTMIVAAQLLFRAPQAGKPTILLLIDRNELEDQMLKNLASVGLDNVGQAHSIAELNRLLKADYRGIIVTTIHKFRDLPANLNLRWNIFVLIDEAHCTTDGDLVGAAGNDSLFRKLCGVLGHPEWADDARFRTNPDRVAHAAVLYGLIEQEMQKRSSAEWSRLLDAAGVPCAPVQNVAQMLEHEQMQALGLLQSVQGLSIPLIGLPLSIDGRRPGAGRAAPALGAHTGEVL